MQTFPARILMMPRILMPRVLMVGTLAMAGSTHAQSGTSFIDWVSPNGGRFDDPGNWSTQSVPSGKDVARFDLDASFDVMGPGSIFVRELLIGDSDVRWSQDDPGKGRAFLSINALLVGDGLYDNPRRLAAPGRLSFDGRLEVQTGDVLLGSGNLASHLVIGPDTRVQTYGLFSTQTASVALVLGGDTSDSWWPRLNVNNGKGGLSGFAGGLVVEAEPLGSGNDALATRHSLIASYGGVSLDQFPYIVSRPRPGYSFSYFVDEGEFGLELATQIGIAESIISVIPAESSDLGTPPRRIVAADLDGDGLDELVVCLGERLANVYPNLGGGRFGDPVAYELPGSPVDASADDFDGDGTIDLAFGCNAPGTLAFLLNPNNDPENLQSGPATTIETEVRSISTSTFVTDESLVSNRGVAVTSSTTVNAGRLAGYVLNGASVVKIAEVEVGDDPGPSDPIDDENKKDPDPPIGVGMNAAAMGNQGSEPTPIFQVLASTPNGFSPVNSVPLTGRAIDFVSGYFDWDTSIDCFVITETGNLDLIRPLGGDGAWSVPLHGRPTSIAAANLAGDLFPEIVIGLADPPRIEVYAIRPQNGSPVFDAGFAQIVLELVSTTPISSAPLAIAATDATPDGGSSGSVAIGIDNGGPSINIGDVDVVPPPDCVLADFNLDGVVGGADLAQIVLSWGPCAGCAADLNGDGEVDGFDLSYVLGYWGDCTTP
jgi:hypothetical protein